MTERRVPSVQEKFQLLLGHLGGLSEFPGAEVEFDSTFDYSVLCAKNPEEAKFYLQALEERGFVRIDPSMNGSPCALTPDGWQ
ncbi:MAG TPA: hypothetical protein VGD64_09345, partial [Acidisarcina sp.]